ncbi:putative peptidoglycan biosynthesis protein MviN [Frondihabitans sp. 762G35]|uniref:murein biosynthesis integral membrane protein MurJ n=1 Tax=Frondihabitans sp. 762G35 TaxID=1446794 RepID=UPI000D214F50|nr:murein biosynthesis integral membrane protein MurJ [Frondihabitans sp. 762G35]ARC58658.1 putative peptidoglycan biosynthesis protein MviN [Frondihabitans sp. 762G35]
MTVVDPVGAENPDPPTASVPVQRSLGRASALLASGTVVSRVLGFAKTAVLAAAIGQAFSGAADAFALSNQLPNNIYALVAGGLLSAVLVPQIVKAARHSDGGQRYINKVVTLGTAVFAVVTLVAVIGAPILVNVYASSAGAGGRGFSPGAIALATAFAYWCLPQIFFYAVYSLLSEILNARQIFGPFTWAPVINNVVSILGLVVFMLLFGGAGHNSLVANWTPGRIVVLAGTATLGVAAQAAFLLLFWKKAGLTFRLDWKWRGVGLRDTGRAAGWMFALILVTQLAGIVQSRVASLGTDIGASNATLANAWLIFMLPHGIVAVSIATAYFTSMTADADRGDLRAVRNNLSESLRAIGLFIVFSAVALAVVAYPFARFYEATFSGVAAMAHVILAYLPGLILFSMLFVLQRVFFAFHEQRTVFFMQLVQSGVGVVGMLVCAITVPPQHIAVAVAVVTSIAGSAQTVVALVLVHRRIGGIDGRWVARRHIQYLVFSLVAGVVGILVVSGLGGYDAEGFGLSGRVPAIITVVIAGVVMAAVYVVLLTAARIPELSAMTRPVLRRLRRS